MKQHLKLNNEVLNTYSATGEIDRQKDKLATKQYFLDEINKKTVFFHSLKEKLDYLLEENYYEKEFLEKYSLEEIKQVFVTAYDYKFRFSSFMSAEKFYKNYALKTWDKEYYLERYEDRMAVVALYSADGDINKALKWINHLMTAYQPATPTFLNLGKKSRGEFVSCYKIMLDDSMNSIAHNLGNTLQLSKAGGGIGVGLTDLRCAGDAIQGVENSASGVMPVCKLLEDSFTYANQLGQRQGSGVVWLHIGHGDIKDFLSAKKPNADEKLRLATLSTGIIIPDIFFELMKKDKDFYLFSPYDIEKVYGKRMSELNFSEIYHDLLDNPNIRKLDKINARKLYTEVKKSQFESGYPFEMFEDNVNEAHCLKQVGRVKILNLCTEIAQLQITSKIGAYYEEDEIGIDTSCNLGSLDVHESTKVDFEELVSSSVNMLSFISDSSSNKYVPSVRKGNELLHSIGLGVMNVHGHLMSQGIKYGSLDSISFIDAYMTALRFFAIKASMNIAKERKETFWNFEKSEYANGKAFEPYMNKELEVNEKVAQALGSVPIITSQMWKELAEQVAEHGMYNAYLLAVAPTGSISYVRSCTASMSPILDKVEVRDYADGRTIYLMPFLTTENAKDYSEAYDINPYDLIDFYAAAQQHVDQAISLTLYVTSSNWNTEDLAKVYIYAWLKGIKSIYYVRQKLQTISECVSCSI